MNCKKCGARNSGKAAFCCACGAPLEAAAKRTGAGLLCLLLVLGALVLALGTLICVQLTQTPSVNTLEQAMWYGELRFVSCAGEQPDLANKLEAQQEPLLCKVKFTPAQGEGYDVMLLLSPDAQLGYTAPVNTAIQAVVSEKGEVTCTGTLYGLTLSVRLYAEENGDKLSGSLTAEGESGVTAAALTLYREGSNVYKAFMDSQSEQTQAGDAKITFDPLPTPPPSEEDEPTDSPAVTQEEPGVKPIRTPDPDKEPIEDRDGDSVPDDSPAPTQPDNKDVDKDEQTV